MQKSYRLTISNYTDTVLNIPPITGGMFRIIELEAVI